MILNIKNTTFIIVTYKSEKIIYDCLNSLPEESKKIIVENSKNINLKKELENKYKNLEVILNENTGFGASNNLGIKKCDTQFAYILNPDTKFHHDTFAQLNNSIKELNDFGWDQYLGNAPLNNQMNDFLDTDDDVLNLQTN